MKKVNAKKWNMKEMTARKPRSQSSMIADTTMNSVSIKPYNRKYIKVCKTAIQSVRGGVFQFNKRY